MANPMKGEIAFDVQGAPYVLTFDFNAICAIEEVFDLPISQIGEKLMDGMRASDLRTLFAAGLQKHQAGTTETQAGEIISVIGAMEAGQHVALGLQASFPEPEPEVASGASRPRKSGRPNA